MNTSVLALATILVISQGYATEDQRIGEPSLDKKASENKRFPHQDFRQSERGDPSEDSRVLEHSTELKNRLEPHELPENLWEFEKLEEESKKHKSHYDGSKEDNHGDPFRETWVDETVEDGLRQSGIFDRETGQKAQQISPQISASPEAAVSPSAPPQPPAPQNLEIPTPPLKRGEWPVLPTPTRE